MKILEWDKSDDMPRLQNLHMGVLEVFGLMMSVLSVRMVTVDRHAVDYVDANNQKRTTPLISEITDEEQDNFLKASMSPLSAELDSILSKFLKTFSNRDHQIIPSTLPPTEESMLFMNVFTTSFRQLQRRIMVESGSTYQASSDSTPIAAAKWFSNRINPLIINAIHNTLSFKSNSTSITPEIDTLCAAGYQTLLQSVYICKNALLLSLWSEMVDIVIIGVSSSTTMSCLGAMKLLTGLLSCSEHVGKLESLKLLQVRKALESIGVMDSRVECRKLAESLLSII
jgi:hypothetical protein